MIRHYPLNNEWKYSSNFREEMLQSSYHDTDMETVRLPHTNVQTPFNHFDPGIYQFVSCYRRHITAESEWVGKQVLLTFDGAAHAAKIYINGSYVITHLGGYTAFTVDIAVYLKYGEDNVIAVELDSRESCNIPPFGYVIDYLTYGGIYREVSLDIKEAVSIADVFIQTHDNNADDRPDALFYKKEVELEVILHGPHLKNTYQIKYTITDTDDQEICSDIIDIQDNTFVHRFAVEGVKNWDINDPNLYLLQLELIEVKAENRILDEKKLRFGFRTCEFRKDGFYLNGRKIKLLGLNRHQSFPYVGYAMPKRMQQLDAEILKNELQVNVVRTSHYPQSQHFLERCDELGLLVITELPGWQHIGDEAWKNTACDNVREMVLQNRNHPSIILWGVRINESQDDDDFYRRTNQIAHQLDSTRQTGGIRNFKKSHLLEDVYTYNDFIHNGRTKGLDRKKDITSNQNAPYMVTEFNGHMFPTKPFDDEEHRMQHALRHTQVLEELFRQEEIAGGTGWCMFDYNTHRDFGSGDMICYHGVMDMFRNPKLAAAVYASQNDNSNVCEVCSSLDIGEHPAGDIKGIYVFTNADSIRLYKNETFIKEFYPDRGNYPGLVHPPVFIDDFMGDLLEAEEHYKHKTAKILKEVLFAVKKFGPNNLPLRYKLKMAYIMLKEHLDMNEGVRLYYKYIGSWGGAATAFRFEAVKNNHVVKVIKKKPSGSPNLKAIANTKLLKEAETYDVAAVRITAVDEDNNLLPYYQEPVTLTTWGAVELIGPSVISLKGGSGGTYVRTKGITGEGGLRVQQADLGCIDIYFRVE